MSVAKKFSPELVSKTETPQRFGNTLELWTVGGASLVWFAACHLLANSATDHVRSIFLMLNLAVNSPHFAASYQLLYRDRRTDIRGKKSYFFAAVIAPLVLLATIIGGFWSQSSFTFAVLIQIMQVAVALHYAGQTFGIALCSSAAEGYIFSKDEKRLLWFNLCSVWILCNLSINQTNKAKFWYGLEYHHWGLNEVYTNMFWAIVGVSLLFLVYAIVRRYIREGRWPSRMAFIVFLSYYAWFLPIFFHARFAEMFYFFHALQYLTFVNILRRNQWRHQFARLAVPDARRALVKKYFVHAAGLIAVASLALWVIPIGLDKSIPFWFPLASVLWSPQVFMGMSHVFFYTHHYVIDAVIWKDNPDLKYLVH